MHFEAIFAEVIVGIREAEESVLEDYRCARLLLSNHSIYRFVGEVTSIACI